jgi:hypothetical protein
LKKVVSHKKVALKALQIKAICFAALQQKTFNSKDRHALQKDLIYE